MDRISKLLKSVNREMKQKIQIFDEETLKFKVVYRCKISLYR